MKEEKEVADPDHDLHHMNEEQLLQEIKRLRAAIRAHRDAYGTRPLLVSS